MPFFSNESILLFVHQFVASFYSTKINLDGTIEWFRNETRRDEMRKTMEQKMIRQLIGLETR